MPPENKNHQMGLLSLGTPLEWPEVKPLSNHVRSHGIKQFLNIYHSVKTRRLDHQLWGEEVVLRINEQLFNLASSRFNFSFFLAGIRSSSL